MLNPALTHSLRDFLQELLAALPFLIFRPQPIKSFSSNRPAPKFSIGDLIATDWVDEFGEDITEFGEVVGLCYLHEGGRSYPDNTWVYYIRWTHNTSGDSDYPQFPCFEWEPSTGDDWRCIGHV